MSVEVRDGRRADLPQVLAINEAAVPAVNSLSLEGIEKLFDNALVCRVAVLGDEVVGFMLCFGVGADYDSVNYTWFAARYSRLLYIDRIALSPKAQRRGLGARLYDEAKQLAARDGAVLACEVNVRPRNDASLAFHERLGFRSVGQQDTDDGAKTVTMLVYEAEQPAAK